LTTKNSNIGRDKLREGLNFTLTGGREGKGQGARGLADGNQLINQLKKTGSAERKVEAQGPKKKKKKRREENNLRAAPREKPAHPEEGGTKGKIHLLRKSLRRRQEGRHKNV